MRKTTIGVADFKAHLSEYLRIVRKGRELTIADRDNPIARVLPYGRQSHTGLVVREAARHYPTLGAIPLPQPITIDVDVVALLIEDREARR